MPLVSHKDSIFGMNGPDNDNSELLEDAAPFLKHKDLEDDLTADGIALWCSLVPS